MNIQDASALMSELIDEVPSADNVNSIQSKSGNADKSLSYSANTFVEDETAAGTEDEYSIDGAEVVDEVSVQDRSGGRGSDDGSVGSVEDDYSVEFSQASSEPASVGASSNSSSGPRIILLDVDDLEAPSSVGEIEDDVDVPPSGSKSASSATYSVDVEKEEAETQAVPKAHPPPSTVWTLREKKQSVGLSEAYVQGSHSSRASSAPASAIEAESATSGSHTDSEGDIEVEDASSQGAKEEEEEESDEGGANVQGSSSSRESSQAAEEDEEEESDEGCGSVGLSEANVQGSPNSRESSQGAEEAEEEESDEGYSEIPEVEVEGESDEAYSIDDVADEDEDKANVVSGRDLSATAGYTMDMEALGTGLSIGKQYQECERLLGRVINPNHIKPKPDQSQGSPSGSIAKSAYSDDGVWLSLGRNQAFGSLRIFGAQ
eukprot:gene16273-22453_t